MYGQGVTAIIRNIVAAVFRTPIIVKRQPVAKLIPVGYHFQRYGLTIRPLEFSGLGWIGDAIGHVFNFKRHILTGLDGPRAAQLERRRLFIHHMDRNKGGIMSG